MNRKPACNVLGVLKRQIHKVAHLWASLVEFLVPSPNRTQESIGTARVVCHDLQTVSNPRGSTDPP
jgi:hypothetical protein